MRTVAILLAIAAAGCAEPDPSLEISTEFSASDRATIREAARRWELATYDSTRPVTLATTDRGSRSDEWGSAWIYPGDPVAVSGIGVACGATLRARNVLSGNHRSRVVLPVPVDLSTAAHEIGHVLGLEHSDRDDDVMAPAGTATWPTAHDVEMLR